jgi:hypothetical protein
VVLLLSLLGIYQDSLFEVDLTYGGGDISRSSLVFCCSKDNGAYGGPLLLSSTTHKLMIYKVNVKVISEKNKHKCPSGFDESRLHSHGLSMAH